MSYAKTTWAAGDKVTSAKLNNIETGIESTDASLTQLNEVVSGLSTSVNNAASADTVSELSNTVNTNTTNIDTNATAITKLNEDYTALNDQVQQNVDVINDNALILDGTVGDVAALAAKLTLLEDKVDALRKTNVVPKSVSPSEFPESTSDQAKDNVLNLTQTEDDLVLTVDEELTNKFLNVTAKSVTAKDMSLVNSKFDATTTGDIAVSSLTTSGNLAKSNSNAMMSFNSPEYVTIKDSALGESGYNCVEIGLKTVDNAPVVPKGVLIENIDFSGTCSNNAISIFGAQDNAIITVKDCTFTKVSNAFRWSNRTNSKGVVINFINCDFVEVDSNPQWSAFFLCQDYTSATAALVEENNLFAPEKLTINCINCTYKGQAMVQPEDPATVWNGANEQQMCVICLDRGAQYIPAYDVARFPIINIK